MIRLFAVAALSLSACGGDDVAAPAAARAVPFIDRLKAAVDAAAPLRLAVMAMAWAWNARMAGVFSAIDARSAVNAPDSATMMAGSTRNAA